MRIAFDVDGTLIDYMDKPRTEIINLLRSIQIALPDAEVFIWSGGGEQYARMIADRIGLSDVITKPKLRLAGMPLIDIAFDDDDVSGLAKCWVQV